MALEVQVNDSWLDYVTAFGTAGAALAAAGAAWVAVRQSRHERVRRLHISAGVDLRPDESGDWAYPEELGGGRGTEAYFIEATNVSRRPITVLSAGFETRPGIGIGVFPDVEPESTRLLEGETAKWWWDAHRIGGFLERGPPIWRVWVRETHGHMHYERYEPRRLFLLKLFDPLATKLKVWRFRRAYEKHQRSRAAVAAESDAPNEAGNTSTPRPGESESPTETE